MNKILSFLFLLIAVQNISCSRSYMVKSETTQIAVGHVNVLAVNYRRPTYEPAMHDDFKLKNQSMDCIAGDELWADLLKNQVQVRDCLNTIQDGKAVYFYHPDAQPYLELDQEEKDNPKCLKDHLAKIPLPREIYFLGRREDQILDEDPLDCFSSSFSTTTNQLAMTPTGFLKKKIEIPFPLTRELKGSKDITLWMMVTVFTLLKSDDQAEGKLLATQVSESLCRSCFKRDVLFDDKFDRRMKPIFWP